MAMKLIKKAGDFRIYQRGDDRYAVKNGEGKPVNGEEKVKILLAEELIKVTLPSEAPAEEEAPEEASADQAEAAAEEAGEEAEVAAE